MTRSALVLRDWPRLDKDKKGLTAKTAIGALYPIERLRGPVPPDGFDELREAIELLVPTKPGTPPDATRFGNRLVRIQDPGAGGWRGEIGDGSWWPWSQALARDQRRDKDIRARRVTM